MTRYRSMVEAAYVEALIENTRYKRWWHRERGASAPGELQKKRDMTCLIIFPIPGASGTSTHWVRYHNKKKLLIAKQILSFGPALSINGPRLCALMVGHLGTGEPHWSAGSVAACRRSITQRNSRSSADSPEFWLKRNRGKSLGERGDVGNGTLLPKPKPVSNCSNPRTKDRYQYQCA